MHCEELATLPCCQSAAVLSTCLLAPVQSCCESHPVPQSRLKSKPYNRRTPAHSPGTQRTPLLLGQAGHRQRGPAGSTAQLRGLTAAPGHTHSSSAQPRVLPLPRGHDAEPGPAPQFPSPKRVGWVQAPYLLPGGRAEAIGCRLHSSSLRFPPLAAVCPRLPALRNPPGPAPGAERCRSSRPAQRSSGRLQGTNKPPNCC